MYFLSAKDTEINANSSQGISSIEKSFISSDSKLTENFPFTKFAKKTYKSD